MPMFRGIIRGVGSLWLGALLLLLLLVVMAWATVFESLHGTEQALILFYQAGWFKLLLALIGMNSLAAIAGRFPFTARQGGFVVTHTAIVIVLAGAWITEQVGVNGQVDLAEGQTIGQLTEQDQPVLQIASPDSSYPLEIKLSRRLFNGLRPLENPPIPGPSDDSMQIAVERYLPDSVQVSDVRDDSPVENLAVQVSFSPDGVDDPQWVFANPSSTRPVRFRVISDPEQWERVLAEATTGRAAEAMKLKIEYEGQTYEYALADCLERETTIEGTELTFRVLRYLPHAFVRNRQLENAPDHRDNPAVEVEFTVPQGTWQRTAFARFPELGAMHGTPDQPGPRLTFIAPALGDNPVPIEILQGPQNQWRVHFRTGDGQTAAHELNIGQAVDTPWSHHRFAILKYYDHARIHRSVEPVEPVRQRRQPAVQVRLTADGQSRLVWVQKHVPESVSLQDTIYTISFAHRRIPLGFAVRLDEFRIETYPGSSRPRSYISRITINDPAVGRAVERTVSMNHPVTHGGFTFYQSSYHQRGDRMASVLSVARDPGKPVVFAGYGLMLLGMFWVIVSRMRKTRAKALADPLATTSMEGNQP
ncbi:MAG: cytochrome c biogenesis protein ResB [Phycisphaerales bacterium]|nr:cytochrome c biogenesis protein ResB [Phycisphaerales bacterium]